MIGARLDFGILGFVATLILVSLGLSACSRGVPTDTHQVQKTEVTINLEALGINRRETFKEVRANALPKAVQLRLRDPENPTSTGLADAGEPFNSTDIIEPGVPMRSLVVAGLSQHYCALSYWQGGMALMFKTSIFELSDGVARLVWVSSQQGGFNLQDLKEEIESRRMHNDLREETPKSYMQEVMREVEVRWVHLIHDFPESSRGKLAIAFEIARDGNVENMRLVASSGDAALDCAAWRSITDSAPFPPLPGEFAGPYPTLRIPFYSNLVKADDRRHLQPHSFSKSTVKVSISAAGSLRVPVGGSEVITAKVRGTSEQGVEWRITGPGCSASTLGKVMGDLYIAPPALPNPAVVTLTASAKADPTAKASIKVHIVEPASAQTSSEP